VVVKDVHKVWPIVLGVTFSVFLISTAWLWEKEWYNNGIAEEKEETKAEFLKGLREIKERGAPIVLYTQKDGRFGQKELAAEYPYLSEQTVNSMAEYLWTYWPSERES